MSTPTYDTHNETIRTQIAELKELRESLPKSPTSNKQHDRIIEGLRALRGADNDGD